VPRILLGPGVERVFGSHAPRIDYRCHRRTLDPHIKNYNFDFARMLR